VAWRSNRTAPQCEDTPDCVRSWHLTAPITPLAYQRWTRPVAALRHHSTCHINRCLLVHGTHITSTLHSRTMPSIHMRQGRMNFATSLLYLVAYTRYSVSRSERKHRLNTAPCHKRPLGETQDRTQNETEVWIGLRDLELHIYRTG
jgi:hypothetical protein